MTSTMIDNLARARARAGTTPAQVNTVKQLIDTARSARNWWIERTRWTVSVNSEDRLWEPALRWFTARDDADHLPRAVAAKMRWDNDGAHDSSVPASDSRRRRARIELLYDVKEERTVTIGGHAIRVALTKPGEKPDDDGYRMRQPDRLTFTARTPAGQRAIVTMLDGLVQATRATKPALYLLSQWGDWSRRDDLPARALDSVVLAKGQMEQLVDDLGQFLQAEEDYTRRGIPWHRGYLLHGPPGTGKTSIVRALSAHFGLDLWYVPLGDLTKDASLLNLISRVEARSILLLEDFDVFRASHDREAGPPGGGVSLAGLLNAVDGVATPHGLITVLTTNDASNIDPAMLRPGRIDRQEYIGLPDRDQLVRLWRSFYSQPEPASDSPLWIPPEGLTPAIAIEAFKRWPDDPLGGIEQIHFSAMAAREIMTS